MRRVGLLVVVVLAAVLVLTGSSRSQPAEAATVDPSWEAIAGAAGVCTDDDVFISVEIVATSPASERGTFTAPGFPSLGFTQDTSFTGTGTFGFTIFTDPFVLPAGTPMTLIITTYNGPNYTGGVSFVSGLTWDCTTGTVLYKWNEIPTGAQPGCDVSLPVPATAVGGTFVTDAALYAEPGVLTSPTLTIPAGQSARVIGLDASGQYYKIAWVCNFLWVRSNTIGPNYDSVWQGRPLPTDVVQ